MPRDGVTVLIDYARLRAWRDETGKSRERVAAELEISGPWLAALETGQPGRSPSVAMLAKLAAYYGHDPGELLLPIGRVAS